MGTLTDATDGMLQDEAAAAAPVCGKVEVSIAAPLEIISQTAQPIVSVASNAGIVVVSPRKRSRFYPSTPCS